MDESVVLEPAIARGWWAVYTKHQHEKAVSEMLAAKGAEVFLPLYEVRRARKQRTVTLSLPLFPGYLFVREEGERRLHVLSTPGVHMIVSHGPHLGIIPDCEIQNLQIAIAARREIEPHPFCRVGEKVRILRGPLRGLEGFLERQKSGCRVVVSVHMLAQAASVEVHVSEVEAVRQSRDQNIPQHDHGIAEAPGTVVPFAPQSPWYAGVPNKKSARKVLAMQATARIAQTQIASGPESAVATPRCQPGLAGFESSPGHSDRRAVTPN